MKVALKHTCLSPASHRRSDRPVSEKTALMTDAAGVKPCLTEMALPFLFFFDEYFFLPNMAVKATQSFLWKGDYGEIKDGGGFVGRGQQRSLSVLLNSCCYKT